MGQFTKRLLLDGTPVDEQKLRYAADCLKRGGLVAIPTETVYGLAANALDPEAVSGIYQAKGRPSDNPLIVHISRMEMLEELAANIPEGARRLAEAFWPGPLTMIFPKKPVVPEITSGHLPTVAVRFPSHPAALRIIDLAGVPLAAPSANLSGSPSPTTAQHCVDDLDGRVDAIVDGGPCGFGVESTVISMAQNPPRLLRPGAITLEQLRAVLGEVEVDPGVLEKVEADQKVASPGMKYKHYAPKAHVVLVQGDARRFTEFVNGVQGEHVWALAFGAERDLLHKPCICYGDTGEQRAQNLFDCLRQLDECGAKTVYARAPRKTGVDLAVYNRLIRAAAFEVKVLQE